MTRFITISLFFLFLIGCSIFNPTSNEEYRQIAWESIDISTKNTIIGGIDSGEVKENTYNGKSSISVTWHTSKDAILGPVTIHIDPFSKQVLGIEPRL